MEDDSDVIIIENSQPPEGRIIYLIDPRLELTDPNPDIFNLFAQFNQMFFEEKLGSVTLKWSTRMTLCAGVCQFHGSMGGCSIRLSRPLLSLRPRRDLVETLLHEMIHAYFFIVDRNREREEHGPKFVEMMNRINRLSGTEISVYHSFHQEVLHFKTHWWKCNGPCQHRSPFFGIVKRAMNRAPGPNDFWWANHSLSCGGQFTKIKEPSPKKKPPSKSSSKQKPPTKPSKSISDYFSPVSSSGSRSITSNSGTGPSSGSSTGPILSSTSGSNNLGTTHEQTPSTSQMLFPVKTYEETPSKFQGKGKKLGSKENKAEANGSCPPPKKRNMTDSKDRLMGRGNPNHPLLALWNKKKV